MTVEIDILALIVVVAAVLVVAFLIPMMVQAKKTARQIDEFITLAQRDILPMLRELREASERINKASAKAEQGVEQVEGLMQSVGEVGDSIHRVNHFLQHDVGRYMGNAAGLWLGIRAASKVLLREMNKDKGGD
ncbi:DUF948 domain-containing protein [Desulfuromonas sp. KJ2020]|uniref:DUF948 domain-containing protein n=1 Tax=Desulfuromonas sp. KJ2020 TaxID=2919173 RepID=UPI00032448AD|nr:DUF948 domain-containing protein [Desulfuromonas sp. KJ2020]MCP3178202.1 DUF948 domain-containing protein [Desulfuromonas sp. KJ2020]